MNRGSKIQLTDSFRSYVQKCFRTIIYILVLLVGNLKRNVFDVRVLVWFGIIFN